MVQSVHYNSSFFCAENSDARSNQGCCGRIYNAYRRAILSLVQFLKNHGWHITAMVIGTLLIESRGQPLKRDY